MEAAEQRAIEHRALGIGMVIAAGIAAEHGQETAAEAILNCAGLTTFAELRALGVEEYDMKLLRRVIVSMGESRRSRWARGFAHIDQLALAA